MFAADSLLLRSFLPTPFSSARPFLSDIEKRWIAFQILNAVQQCHAQGICHGGIKCENVMVTSWNWVLLTDFASMKPSFIPEDDPTSMFMPYFMFYCLLTRLYQLLSSTNIF